MAMTGYEGLWGYLVLVLVGFLPSDTWRLLGVWVGRGIDEESELLVWVRAVATAVLAGVIAKIAFSSRRARWRPSRWRCGLRRSGVVSLHSCWYGARSSPGCSLVKRC